MFTLIFLYTAWYLLTMICIYYYFFIFQLTDISTKLSFSRFWGLLTHYHSLGWIFKFFILQISGLPPFFFFFLKFVLLEQVIVKASYLLFFLIFTNFLLGMFFYLKIFSAADYSLSDDGLKEIATRPFIGNRNYYYFTRVYYFTFFSIFVLFFSFFTVIFIGDLSGIFVDFLV